MRRNWIKLYVDQTLRGSCFDELLPDERFIWFGFLLLAGDNAHEGKISITERIGYTNKQLAELLKCKKSLILRSIRKLLKVNKVKLYKNNIIKIVNWQKYQSEYQRQKPYRDERLQQKVTSESNGIEREGERERDKYSEDSIELRLSKLLITLIKKRNPDHKEPDLQKWAYYIDLMIRIDKRNPDVIEKIIIWCQQDEFWQNNILSTGKLRKQYDQLFLKMKPIKSNSKEQDWSKVKTFKEEVYEHKPIPEDVETIMKKLIPNKDKIKERIIKERSKNERYN